MNKYQLYKLLRKHEDLKVKRHPMFDKNRFMKFLLIFMWLYYAAILIFMGVTMAIGMKGAYNGVAAFHVLDGWFPIVLIIDFWIRTCTGALCWFRSDSLRLPFLSDGLNLPAGYSDGGCYV